MREILFKAKHKNWRELPKEEWWVEGYYCYFMDTHCVLPRNLNYDAAMFGEQKVFAIIDPETLCQYTGLKDKDGSRIWENDIVSCEHKKYPYDDSVVFPLLPDPIKYKRNYAVKFINTGSNYGYILRNKSIHFMLTGNVVYNHKIEVVGNVFDDKYLLDEKEGLNEVAKRI